MRILRRISVIVLAAMIAVVFTPGFALTQQFGYTGAAYAAEGMTGSGTAEDPYVITSEAGLKAFAEAATVDDCAAVALLDADIEMTEAWTAIKSQYISTAFAGTFDGQGHTISNLNVSGSGEQGFFGFLRGGTIKNLTVKGSVSSTNNHAGGIVGKMAFGTIENCSFIGTVTTATTANNGYAGGIAGYEGFSGSATATSSISGCSNYGTITGKYAGGITGYVKYGTITNSYNSGTISGVTRSGGIAGQAQNNVTIENAYSIGENAGTSSTKGDIVDFLFSSAKLVNCYYTDLANGGGTGTTESCDVIDKDTLLSKLGSAFAADENNINNGYPILGWEAGSAPVPKDPKLTISGNTDLYMTNSGSPKAETLTVNYVDMDPVKVNWTIESGEDVISVAAAETAGENNQAIVITPKKSGTASIKVSTEDGTYTAEASVNVFPYITAISMNGTPVVGETYAVDVTVLGGQSYDFQNDPKLDSFTWKYFDSREAWQQAPSGGTVITGKTHEIEIPAEAAGKWLTVTLFFQGENKTPGSPYGKTVLAQRIPVASVTVEGASEDGDILTAETGATLKAIPAGPEGAEPTEVTFQWMKKTGDSFAPIEGATDASYQIADEESALNEEYQVVVSGAADSTAASKTIKVTTLSDKARQKAEDEAILKEAADKYSLGVMAPTCGRDSNIAEYLSNDLIAKGYEGITVSVAGVEKRSYPNGGDAAIAEDGTITYFYADPSKINEAPYSNSCYGQFDVDFLLKKGDAEQTLSKVVNLYWDTDKLCSYIQETVLDQVTWEMIKGENEEEGIAKADLSLPVFPKNIDSRLFQLKWTSDNTEALAVTDPKGDASEIAYADRIGKVSRSNEDQPVTLHLTVSYGGTNNNATWETAAIEALSRDITVTVPKWTEEEIQEGVRQELEEKLSAGFEKKGLTDYVTGEALDLSNVTGDIRIPTTRDFGVDGAVQPVTITSDNTDVIDYPRSKDDETKPQNNAARAYVYRPLPSEGAQQVTLTITITDKETGVAVSRDFPVTVQPLTEEELSAARSFMEKAAASYWDGIRAGNEDKDRVNADMHPFIEIIQKEDGTVGFVYDESETTGAGIRPATYVENPDGSSDSDYRRFNLSDTSVVAQDTLLLDPDREDPDINVTIDSYLSHEIFGSYYEKFKDNAAKAEVFRPFYRQHAEVSITVLGIHRHTMVHHDAKEPTEKEDGNIEYWFCPGCSKYFADEAGTTELEASSVILPKTGSDEEPAAADQPAAKGTSLTTSAGTFTVTSSKASAPAVTFTKGTDKATQVIPATVTVNKVKYKVTAIAPKAFLKNKKIKKVTVGANILTIGAQAFSKCPKLKTVVIGKNVKKIGAKTFAGSRKLKTLTVKSKKLTKAGVKNSLKGSKIKTVKVKVGSKKLNKKYVKKYKKFFTKKNCGAKVTVK